MRSIDLLALINEQRLISGEGKLRNNDFVAKIEDEIDDLLNYETFVDKRGKKIKFYHLNKDQCMLVAMRESKSVRKNVLTKIKELEAQQSPKLPTTFAEALQLAADQARQLELAAPKVAFVDNCVERSHLMTATQVAQKHNMSAIKLNRLLGELDVYNKSIKRSKAFRQWFIDDSLGEMKQTEMGHSQCLFTGKGEQWINKKFIDEGVI